MRKAEEYIWYEKYRPRKIEDFILTDDIKSQVEKYISEKNIDHIIFYGSWGTGKTSLTNFLIKELDVDSLSLNASNRDERGIDVVNDKIIPFAQRMSFSSFKIVDLRESEKLTTHAQEALKDVIEEYHDNCKFIFTTNNINKLNGAIRSRCVSFHIKPTDKKAIAKRLWNISKLEKIKADPQDILKMVDAYYPDIRSCVKNLQRFSTDGKLNITDLQVQDDYEKIGKFITASFEKNKKERIIFWKKIRSIISSMSEDAITDTYSYIFDNAENIFPQSVLVSSLLIISEYMYRSSQVIDKEVMLSSCILQLINQK